MYNQQYNMNPYGQPVNPVYNPNPAYNPNPSYYPNPNPPPYNPNPPPYNPNPPPYNSNPVQPVQMNVFNNSYPQQRPIYEGPQPSAQIIFVNDSSNNNDLSCPYCRCKTQTILMTKSGGVTYMWCFLICLLSGGILCCLPFCIDSCKDRHLMCIRCNNAKQVIPANCL